MPLDNVVRPDWNHPTEKTSAPESFPAPVAQPSAQCDERGQIVRPPFNFNKDGSPVEPAPKSHDELVREIANHDLKPGEVAPVPDGSPTPNSEAHEALLSRWDKEGFGREKAVEAVQQALITPVLQYAGEEAQSLQASFDTKVPAEIQNIVFDAFRLSPDPRSAEPGLDLLNIAEANMTPAQRETALNWLNGLSVKQRQAIYYGLNSRRQK